MESPPAFRAEGRAIAMGASADPIYTIRAIRAIIQATVSPLIDVLDLIDADSDAEDATDVEDEGVRPFLQLDADAGPGCAASDAREHDGTELDQSFPETAGPRGHVISGRASPFEDAEPDDDDCGGDEAEPDFARAVGEGPGCAIPSFDHLRLRRPLVDQPAYAAAGTGAL